MPNELIEPDRIDAADPIGQIVTCHGLKGELKVEPLTDFPSRFREGASLLLRGELRRIESVRWIKDRAVVKLEGIDTRTDAERLQWEFLYLPERSEPELQTNEYKLEDLVGMIVVTEAGRLLGKIADVLPYPAHDVISVCPQDSEPGEAAARSRNELLIPAVSEFVKRVDLERGRMTVRLLEGMEPE